MSVSWMEYFTWFLLTLLYNKILLLMRVILKKNSFYIFLLLYLINNTNVLKKPIFLVNSLQNFTLICKKLILKIFNNNIRKLLFIADVICH